MASSIANKNSTFNLPVKDILLMLALALPGYLLATKIVDKEPKWYIAVFGSVLFLAFFSITRHRVPILVAMFFFLLPVNLDYHIIYDKLFAAVVIPMYGVLISAYEGPMYMLLLLWLFSRIYKPEKLKYHIRIFGPYLLLFACALYGADRSTAYPIITFGCLWYMVQCALIILFMGNFFKTEKMALLIAYMLVASIILQAIVGFGQFFTGGHLGLEIFGEVPSAFRIDLAGITQLSRVGGTIGSPNSLAMYLGMVIPLSFTLLFAPMRQNIKLLFLAPVFISGVLLEYMTYSRGGWISLAAGLSVALYVCLIRRYKNRFLMFLGLAVIGIISAGIILLTVGKVRERLFEEDYGAAKSRIPMMQLASNMIEQNPFFGVGIANYTSISHQYDDTRESISYVFPFPVHNEYMLIAAELGIPALIFFLAALWGTMWVLFKQSQSIDRSFMPYFSAGLLGGLVCWSIHALVDFSWVVISVRFWSYLGIAFMLQNLIEKNEEKIRAEGLPELSPLADA